MSLVKDTSTGQVVEFIGYHDRDYAMVRDTAGKVYYPPLTRLLFFEAGVGASEEGPKPQSAEKEVDENKLPTTVIPADSRMNINLATAEQMVRLKGIGYATAKKIVELRNSLPGERFRELKQLRVIERVNWDEVFELDEFFIA